MTATVAAFVAELGRRMPWSKSAGWDPVGLQLGDPDAPAGRVVVCHEVTAAIVDRVVADPTDLLVTYHPLLFDGTRRLVAGSDAAGRAWRLIRAGVALAVVHTAFDVVPGGAADALASALDLEEVAGFAPLWGADSVKIVTFVPAGSADTVADAMAAAGAGTIGNYRGCSFRVPGTGTFFAGPGTAPVSGTHGEFNREAEIRVEMNAPAGRRDAVVAALTAVHPYEEPAFDVYERSGDVGFVGRVGTVAAGTTLAGLASLVAGRLGGVVRIAGDPASSLERVAVVPGAGSGTASAAAAAGADALVTGDVTHHRAREAMERGLSVVDPGHAATERPGLQRLYAAVAELAGGAVDLTGVDADPWRPGAGDR